MDARQMRSLDNLQRQGRLCGRWEGGKQIAVIPSNSLPASKGQRVRLRPNLKQESEAVDTWGPEPAGA